MVRSRTVVIGTRGSPLALAQAEIVANLLQKENNNLEVLIKKIKTEGDIRFRSRISTGKDLFTKEIDRALKNREIDIAVHSLKDVPVESKLDAEIEIAAYPKREDPRDVLISKNKYNLKTLPRNANIGTSSKRRAIQLKAVRDDVRILELHGNVGTRLERLDSTGMDAIVLARAGLNRLRKVAVGVDLSTELMIPATGQGCLAVTIRRGDKETRRIVGRLDHEDTRAAVTAERSFSKSIGGGCNTPTAAYAVVQGNNMIITGLVERSSKGEVSSFREKPSKVQPQQLEHLG